jgi:hypothetical protein
MCYLNVPITIKNHVIKYIRSYLWRKTDDDESNGLALVAWTVLLEIALTTQMENYQDNIRLLL